MKVKISHKLKKSNTICEEITKTKDKNHQKHFSKILMHDNCTGFKNGVKCVCVSLKVI